MSQEQSSQPEPTRAPAHSNFAGFAGTTLGKYHLLEKLGQGGMAQVYRAHQSDLDRFVAIKVLHPHLTGDDEFAARFRREAQAVAALEHPNIVRVYDFDTADDLAFLVMECVVGKGLKEQLRELVNRGEHMPLARVTRIVGDLADALDYAHARGIIHRDLKPANVILTAQDRAVLTDFGVARMIDATAITGTHDTLGTPAYMSPEQGRGESGDARSDVYALGVLLYQLCTGKLPFDADTPYAIVLKHITAPLPSPRSVRPDLPESIERVILKSLAKNPNERFQTAGALSAALRAAREANVRAPRHLAFAGLRARWNPLRRPNFWQSIAVVAVTLLVCLVIFWVSTPWRAQRFLARVAPTPTLEAGVGALVLEGADYFVDTWLDPTKPDEVGQSIERAQLRAPQPTDRILIAMSVARLPPDSEIISATLTLHVEAQIKNATPCRLAAYRLATLWRPTTATYNAPWSAPGLVAGVDYDSTPAERIVLPDAGLVALNLTQTIAGWHKRGRAGGGVVLMLAEDNASACQYWVDLTEQTNPANRPTLHITYKEPQ